jgi:alanine racemase
MDLRLTASREDFASSVPQPSTTLDREGGTLVRFDERVAAALAWTHALIDLDALAGNVAALLAHLPAGTGLMAVAKANAYGHGLVPCTRAALDAGATHVAVARVEEGLLLRESGITVPILVLGPSNPLLIRHAVSNQIALAVGSLEGVRAVVASLADGLGPARLHLKIDSGMHRYGVQPDAALDLARAITRDSRLVLQGLFTHFATADAADDRFLREQVRRFSIVRQKLADAGINPPLVHLANSPATLRQVPHWPELRLAGEISLVRTGVAMYGLSPSDEVPVSNAFRPVMTLKTRLARVFSIAPGEGVSYGLTYIAPEHARCATLPLGYGDGLARQLSNRGWAVVHGTRCPIRGRVSMDQTVVEIGALDAAEGDEAIVIGDGQDAAMTASQAAALYGTINYEVVTAIPERVPRVYLRGGRPVAVLDLIGLAEPECSPVNSPANGIG